MRVQVLVAAMNQTDHSLLSDMNIQSDVIVGNQCDRNEIEDFEWNGFDVKYLSFSEKGVGLNRNNALMRADGDILLFADDDLRYRDGYPEMVVRVFQEHPDADMIIFNLDEEKKDTAVNRYVIKQVKKVGWLNFLRYGAARIAVKRQAVLNNGISFHLCFGGGTDHQHGEDNIFIADCLRKKMRIYTAPDVLATLMDVRESTWHKGYNNEKYLKDQGCLYWNISRRWWRLICAQDAVRYRARYRNDIIGAYRTMVQGVKEMNGRANSDGN